MGELRIERAGVNLPKLDEELRASLAGLLNGLRVGEDFVEVVIDGDEEAVRDQVEGVVAAHDPALRTARQAIAEDAAAAEGELAGMIANRIAWHKANPVTSANAVTVLTRLQVEWVAFLRLLYRDLA